MNMRGKRKIGRKILAFVLSVCMLFTVQPNLWDGVMVQAAEKVENDTDSGIMTADDSEHHAGWTALSTDTTEAITLSEGKYYLSGGNDNEITMGTITIAGNVTLCLNGQTLTHSGGTGSVIVVESGTFTLCDCQDDYTYSWNGSKENPVYTLDGSGGCITGGNGYNSQGGGVYVKANATFVMNSGRITDCNVGTGEGHDGGGVYVATQATFEMAGGFIENNAADSGGGVGVEGCFIMSNKAIIMNNVSSSGGGVGITSGSGSFTMRGGKIIGNTASSFTGGGVEGYLNATISMEGGLIEGNSAKTGGGGLYITTNSPTKLSGGTIRYNRMSGSAGVVDAGGVRLLARASTLELSGSIAIYDNYYNDGTISNVYLPNNASVTITGPLTNRVGITSQTKPPTVDNGAVLVANENTSEDYDWHCIVSDENFRVIKLGSQILLAERTGNPVTLTAYKDGLEWVENPPTYKLTSDNGTSFVTDLTAVPDGEYHVYDGDTDTGVTVTVDGAAATAEVYYHTVTFYDGDTALTTPAQQIVLKGATASAPTDNPTKTGHTFSEWVTTDGGSTAYDFTQAVNAKTLVYASWTPIEYTISYNLAGGTLPAGKTNPENYTIETADFTLQNPADRIGYTFTGWSGTGLTANTTAVTISKGSTGERNYVANWTANTYSITLNGKGNSGSNLTGYQYGTGATLPTDWTKTGYDFAGWYANEDCTGDSVTEISATETGDRTFWAKWTPISYTISYELDGGMVTGNPTTYTVESSTITLKNPTKEGYTFTGWSGTDLTGNNNMSVTIAAGSTGDREYTAHWTGAGYKVTLNGNGGKGGTSLTSYKHGTETALPTNWTRAGYTFAGWYEDESCKGTAITKIPDTATGDREYWAGWTANTYTISYNLDGGTAAGNPASYTVESDAITLTNPTKEGYTFTGWSGTGLTGEQNTTVTIPKGSTGNRTYTAHWKLADYTVALHPNGGTGGTDLTAYTYGTVTTLPTNWTKKGYVFDGWYDKENLTGTAVTNISATDTGNKEYWAKWTDNIAPVIGTLTYNYQPKNLWQWLIGKDSLVITVPVTEEGSGADKITYTLTPDGGTAEQKTAEINNGKAEITLSPDFKGTVSITCTDKANNTSAGVTVGAGAAPNGIIIEDNAPQIAFQAKNAERLPSGEYKTAPDITVTVADNKDNAISGGIASVSYKIGNGSEKTVAHDYTTGMVVNDSFTIPASEIPAGETEITVTATDNAGNSNPQRYTVKVHTHSGTLVPAVEPTCTTAGNKEYYTCSCGEEFSNSGCTVEITDHAEVIKKALGHDFTGKYQFDTEEHWMKCSRCPATDSREAHSFGEGSNHCTKCEFEKAGEGHTHKGELHEKVEPTCTTKGNTAYYTCNCGKWFSDSSCTKEITDKSKIEIPALEHDFVMKQDQNEHWRQCSRCSLEQSKGLHEYDDDSDTDCNVCGYVRTVQHTHSGTLVPAVEATCTEDGHEAYYTCSCGKWFSDSGCVNKITDHASVTVEKRGHDFSGGYQSDENGHWKLCARCNVAQTAENHVFDDEYDTDCNQCGYRRNIGNPGNVSKDVEKDEKAPDTVLSDSAEELADTILTEEEKGQIGNGTDIKFILNVKDAGDTVSSGDKTAVQQVLGGNAEVKGFSVGQYLDISLFKVIGDTRSAISQTARKLTIVIHVPESLKRKDSAKPRTYAIIRVHDGVAEVLADLDGDADTVTIATDRFSAYALVYKEAGGGADVTPSPTPGGGDQPTPTPGGSDKPSPTPGGSDEPTPTPGGSDKPSPTPGGKDNVTPAPSPSEKPEQASGKEKRKIEIHSGLKAIQTGKKLQVSWGRVTGADGYSVYVQYCGKDFSTKSLNQVKSGKKTRIIVKKVNGKKLDTTKNFKLYVVAWKWKNGKKSTLAKTLTIHVAGKDSVKYTNVKSIRLKKTSYTLKKGGTVTLRPKAVLYDKHKKQLSAAHCKEFRYLSSNKKVATVTAGGKVKAKGTGECTIYVFAKNGCRRKIKIKVKK